MASKSKKIDKPKDTVVKPKSKAVSKADPISYVSVEEYLLTRNDLSDGVKAGFSIYMKGRKYQHSYDDFDKEFKKYLTRKI